MPRVSQRETLFGTLLASGPQRKLLLKPVDFAVATSFHVALFAVLIWLTTHNAKPAMAYESNVNTLMLTDNTSLTLHSTTYSAGVMGAAHPSSAPGTGERNVAVALPEMPLTPDLNDVMASIASSVQVASVTIGNELIRAVASQLDASLARDTLPHIPTVDELVKSGPTIIPYTSGPELMNRPQVSHLLQARYPRFLADQGEGGVTALWLLVDKDGSVRRAKVASSSGFHVFDETALEVVPFMHFRPATNHGYVTPVWVQLPVRFRVISGD